MTILTAVLCLVSCPSAARETYQECVTHCEEGFPNVADDEKTCAETVAKIHHDVGRLREFLTSKHRCRGRYRKKCKQWKSTAINDLAELSTLTLESSDCTQLEAVAIEARLAPFDTALSCSGDRIFTDIHDLLGRRRSYLNKIMSLDTRYKYLSRRHGRDPDSDMRLPNCDGKSRGRRYYLWPLLQFYVSLTSLDEYQTCMSKCRKPTAAEKTLWKLEKQVLARLEESKPRSTAINQMVVEREQLYRQEGVNYRACRALDEGRRQVSDADIRMKKMREELVRLLSTYPPPPAEVKALAQDLSRYEKQTAKINPQSIAESCRADDITAEKLETRRQSALTALSTGELFSLKAVSAFRQKSPSGEECNWTGDCQVPLTCEDNKCRGKLTDADIADLLAEADSLQKEGTDLQIYDDKGLRQEAEKEVSRLEKGYQELAARLVDRGWQKAVQKWSGKLTGELNQTRLDVAHSLKETKAQQKQICAQFEQDEKNRTCRKQIEKLDDLSKRLEVFASSLDDAEPTKSPRWIQLKYKDLTRLKQKLEEIRSWNPPEAPATTDTVYYLLAVLLMVMATIVAVLVWRTIRKRHRAKEF